MTWRRERRGLAALRVRARARRRQGHRRARPPGWRGPGRRAQRPPAGFSAVPGENWRLAYPNVCCCCSLSAVRGRWAGGEEQQLPAGAPAAHAALPLSLALQQAHDLVHEAFWKTTWAGAPKAQESSPHRLALGGFHRRTRRKGFCTIECRDGTRRRERSRNSEDEQEALSCGHGRSPPPRYHAEAARGGHSTREAACDCLIGTAGTGPSMLRRSPRR